MNELKFSSSRLADAFCARTAARKLASVLYMVIAAFDRDVAANVDKESRSNVFIEL